MDRLARTREGRLLTTVDKIYLWGIIIISSNCFGLYQKIEPLTQIYFTDMITIVLLCSSTLYLCLHLRGIRFVLFKSTHTRKFAQTLLLITLAETVLSFVRYGEVQSFVSTIRESIVPLAIVATFFSLKKIVERDGIEYLIYVIIITSIICSCIAILAYVLLDTTGNNFFNLDVENYSFYRYNKPHFMIGAMIVVPATLFSWILRLNKNKDYLTVLSLILGLFHIIIIGKTRTLIAFTLITMIIVYIYITKKSKNFKIVVMVACVFVYLILEKNMLIESISVLFTDNSVTFRLNAIEFYLDQVAKHPLFGMGFIGRSNESLKHLLYGPKNQYYRTDVGFVGFMNEFGLVGAIWFINLVIYACRVVKRVLKNNGLKNDAMFAWVFLIFIVISSINLFSVDPFRIIYLPLILVLLRNLESKDKNMI